jgi:hypothetical protein
MMICPVCHEERPSREALLEHVWGHLTWEGAYPSSFAYFGSCWCGFMCSFREWAAHMEEKDVQAHYLEHYLGIHQ